VLPREAFFADTERCVQGSQAVIMSGRAERICTAPSVYVLQLQPYLSWSPTQYMLQVHTHPGMKTSALHFNA